MPTRRRCLMLLTAAAGWQLAGCDAPSAAVASEDVQRSLVGTWLREYDEADTHVRRVLVLESDGSFHESASITPPAGAVLSVAHEGNWLFDGTNLKRKYTMMSGKPVAASRAPFATFELSFEGHNEFVGVDNVHHRQIRYRRVAEGTRL